MSLDPCPLYDPSAPVLTPTSPTPEPESTFELLITLVHPSKRVRTSNRKTKNAKSESENKGPYDISINTDWSTFLGIMANKLSVQQSDLADETGFLLMLKKVKSKFEPYVMICMSAPVQRAAAESSGGARVVEELDSDFEDCPAAKKAKLDDVLEGIVGKLEDKYMLGLCSSHPDLPCFHHCANDLHFKLDHPRLLADLALKHPLKNTVNYNTTAAPPAPSTPTPNMAFAQMPFMGFPQFPQTMFPPVYSPFMGYGVPGNSFSPAGFSANSM
ncbi:hypothetical protein BC826DRAFT_1113105 [Russula brevipes]|nr:hypothetical protein BC826DRAFT_1113105 [Russula brevipes]